MNSKSKFFLFIIFLVLSVLIAISSGYFSINLTFIEAFSKINPIVSASLYNLIYIILGAFSFSTNVMTGIGVFLFPKYLVVIYSMIGIMGSSIIDFYIARKLGRNYVRNYIEKRGGKLEKFDKIIEKDTFKTIFALSAVIFVPPAISYFLGGVMKINLKKYSLAIFLGNFFNIVFLVYLFSGFINSNTIQILVSIIGLTIITSIALYMYNGEIKDIFKLSFPWFFRKSHFIKLK